MNSNIASSGALSMHELLRFTTGTFDWLRFRSNQETLSCQLTNLLWKILYHCAMVRVVDKSSQLAKFAGFSARFCWLLLLLQESWYGEEIVFISSKCRCNENARKSVFHCSVFKNLEHAPGPPPQKWRAKAHHISPRDQQPSTFQKTPAT